MTWRLALLMGLLPLWACSKDEEPVPSEQSQPAPVVTPRKAPPRLLYLPDGGDIAPPRAPGQQLLPGPWGHRGGGACPADMVDIAGAFCIDRFEAVLVDAAEGRKLSPYYHPSQSGTRAAYGRWRRKRLTTGNDRARMMPVPEPPAWQLSEVFSPKALSQGGVTPNGYLDLNQARTACGNAGKRLCREEEWVMACKGEARRKFPYGDSYQSGRCNVFRESHPAVILHGKASVGHRDPRLNQTDFRGDPLLRPTGASRECQSRWGDDAVYDMVGNLDEWVDDPDGVFVGGFFSRSTREGCEARISAHAPAYYDYSLGVRCCK